MTVQASNPQQIVRYSRRSHDDYVIEPPRAIHKPLVRRRMLLTMSSEGDVAFVDVTDQRVHLGLLHLPGIRVDPPAHLSCDRRFDILPT